MIFTTSDSAHGRSFRSSCLLLLIASFLFQASRAAEPLRLVMGREHGDAQCSLHWGPYLVLQEVLTRRLNVIYTCHALPWARAQREVENGSYDGFVAIVSDERLRYVNANVVALHTAEMHLFMRAEDIRRARFNHVSDLATLKAMRYVTAVGDNWAKTRMLPLGFEIDWANGSVAILRKIVAARGDFTVDTPDAIAPYISSAEFSGKIVMLDAIVDRVDSHLMLRKTSNYLPLLTDIDRELLAMKKDGSLAKLQRQNPLNRINP